VSLANRMALASPHIRAVCVEANEFPYLSNQFRVRGVPHTVINRRASFVGALPEPDFVAAVLEGAGVPLDEGTLHPNPPPQGGKEIPARGPSTEIAS
jgi:hypothetical protein